MDVLLEIVVRTIGAFVLILIVTQKLGKQTVAQLTYHDFVAGIALGALTANIAYNTKIPSWHPAVSLLIFCGIAYILSIISIKSRKSRRWLSGRPTIVIENGKILEENMRKQKLTLDTLNQELREKNIFDINEVQHAVLELNGNVSVLKKHEFQPVTKKDLNLLTSPIQEFPVELIMDGKLIEENLKQNRIPKDWINKELEKRQLQLEDVCYAVKGTNSLLYFDLYKDQLKKPVDKES